jgi:hypothetical protein
MDTYADDLAELIETLDLKDAILVGAMAATVMRDGAKAVGRHEDRLVVPGVGIERPAMAEHDRLARAPVLVEDLGAVLRVGPLLVLGDCRSRRPAPGAR